MEYEPKSDFKPQKDSCVKGFIRAVASCSISGDKENPMDFKTGGTNTVGLAKYGIEPIKKRRHADKTFMGGCDCEYMGLFHECWMSGHWWVSRDNGKRLDDQVDECVLLPDT